MCELLISPAIESHDPDLTILALECLGLISILQPEIFKTYSPIFMSVLELNKANQQESVAERKDKIVTLKSTVDALVRHGILTPECEQLFSLVSREYIFVSDPLLKQVAIEGVCKMLFAKKLCEDFHRDQVEAALFYLLVQLFDKTYNSNNSLVVSILSVFFQNIVLFSKERANILVSALTKLTYSHIVSKYRLLAGKKPAKRRQKMNSVTGSVTVISERDESSSDESDQSSLEDSEFDAHQDLNCSQMDDFDQKVLKQVNFQQVISSLDVTQIVELCLGLLSQQYIQENGIYRQNVDLSVEFGYRLLQLQQSTFKQVKIFKESIVPLLGQVRFSKINSLVDLDKIQKLWNAESSRAVQ